MNVAGRIGVAVSFAGMAPGKLGDVGVTTLLVTPGFSPGAAGVPNGDLSGETGATMGVGDWFAIVCIAGVALFCANGPEVKARESVGICVSDNAATCVTDITLSILIG